MDKSRLAQEVLEEVMRRLAIDFPMPATGRHADAPKAAVLGRLSNEETEILESSLQIVPIAEEGWELLLLAELSPQLLCGLALGVSVSEEAKTVIEALLEGKRVCMLESGLAYRRYKDSAPKTLYLQYQEYEERLLRFGIERISHVSDLSAGYGRAMEGACADLSSLRLLRESDLIRVKSQGYRQICLGAQTIVTPLAGDYISNHRLQVRRRDEVRAWK